MLSALAPIAEETPPLWGVRIELPPAPHNLASLGSLFVFFQALLLKLPSAKILSSFRTEFSYYLARTVMRPFPRFFLLLLVLLFAQAAFSQTTTVTGQVPRPDSNSFAKEPYVIEEIKSLLRYEADGKGRRELTFRARIQSESATHDFGLLIFSYAASFESLDINYIRVRKPDGSVVSTPASDVQDVDSAVSRQAPMYTDEREKHVAIKSLSPGDILEYSLTWTVHDPIAPGHFWLDDNFVKTAICLNEELEVNVPRDLPLKIVSGSVTPTITEEAGRRIYKLHSSNLVHPEEDKIPDWEKNSHGADPPVVQISSFQSWAEVGGWFSALVQPQISVTPEIRAKAEEITKGQTTDDGKIRSIYAFVSSRIRYIGIDLGAGRYTPHRAAKFLESAWWLMPEPMIGYHLAQVLERLGENQKALQIYIATNSSIPPNTEADLRKKLEARISALFAKISAPAKAAPDLQSMRTYRLPQIRNWGGGFKSAQFVIALEKLEPLPSVSFISGAEELVEAKHDLEKLDFHSNFPDDGPTRIVREGVLSCSSATKLCTFAFFPVPAPRVLNMPAMPSLENF
jgi:hypothetical protein